MLTVPLWPGTGTHAHAHTVAWLWSGSGLTISGPNHPSFTLASIGCLLCLLLGAGDAHWQMGTHWPGRRSIDLGMSCLLRLLLGWLGAWLLIPMFSSHCP